MANREQGVLAVGVVLVHHQVRYEPATGRDGRFVQWPLEALPFAVDWCGRRGLEVDRLVESRNGGLGGQRQWHNEGGSEKSASGANRALMHGFSGWMQKANPINALL